MAITIAATRTTVNATPAVIPMMIPAVFRLSSAEPAKRLCGKATARRKKTITTREQEGRTRCFIGLGSLISGTIVPVEEDDLLF
jgi:hypothetical protein